MNLWMRIMILYDKLLLLNQTGLSINKQYQLHNCNWIFIYYKLNIFQFRIFFYFSYKNRKIILDKSFFRISICFRIDLSFRFKSIFWKESLLWHSLNVDLLNITICLDYWYCYLYIKMLEVSWVLFISHMSLRVTFSDVVLYYFIICNTWTSLLARALT